MKAPWGTAIATLGKDIENRSWKPPATIVGRRIAIHQGAGLARDGLRMLEKKHGRLDCDPSVIVCTALVRGWVDDDGNHSDSLTAREAQRARRSKWYQGPVGWVLASVRRPRSRIKAKGMLGLWSLPKRTETRLLQGPRR